MKSREGRIPVTIPGPGAPLVVIIIPLFYKKIKWFGRPKSKRKKVHEQADGQEMEDMSSDDVDTCVESSKNVGVEAAPVLNDEFDMGNIVQTNNVYPMSIDNVAKSIARINKGIEEQRNDMEKNSDNTL
ncbi:hypothetical protein QQ045_007038 [Rhodiola kirilowii]